MEELFVKDAFSCRVVSLREAADPVNDVFDGEAVPFIFEVVVVLAFPVIAPFPSWIPARVSAQNISLVHALAFLVCIVSVDSTVCLSRNVNVEMALFGAAHMGFFVATALQGGVFWMQKSAQQNSFRTLFTKQKTHNQVYTSVKCCAE